MHNFTLSCHCAGMALVWKKFHQVFWTVPTCKTQSKDDTFFIKWHRVTHIFTPIDYDTSDTIKSIQWKRGLSHFATAGTTWVVHVAIAFGMSCSLANTACGAPSVPQVCGHGHSCRLQQKWNHSCLCQNNYEASGIDLAVNILDIETGTCVLDVFTSLTNTVEIPGNISLNLKV